MKRKNRASPVLLLALLLALGSAPQLFSQQGVITTIAGGGVNGPSPRLTDIGNPTCIAIDASGSVYFAAFNMNQVFKLDFRGSLAVVAGTGTSGDSGDGGPATGATLGNPMGVAVDRQGNLFVSDTLNRRVRRVDALTGIITTVAGNGKASRLKGDGELARDVSVIPYALALDDHGNLFIGDANRIRRVDASTGIITTVAGNGQGTFSGDGGAATSAGIGPIWGLALDAHSNLFLTDMVNNRVRRVDAATGIITTVAGNGAAGFRGDGGPAVSASLNWPYGVTLDNQGNLYVGDQKNHRVRRLDTITGIITTVAGNGLAGFHGEGESATSAGLSPGGVAVDGHGNILIADPGNHRILRVEAKGGTLTTIAGGGAGGDNGPAIEAIVAGPTGVAADSSGDVFIAEYDSERIRRVDVATGVITTVAGNGTEGFGGDNGPATEASLFQASAVAVNAQGDLFIADPLSERVRRVDAQTGIITPVAGGGYGGDGGPAVEARLNVPQGVAVDRSGNLFIAEARGNRVRRIDRETGIITTAAGGGRDRKAIGDGGPATNATLDSPWRVAVDAQGNLFIAEAWGGRIRRVDGATGTITTVSKNLRSAQDVAVDVQGNVFVALTGDRNASQSKDIRILRIDAVTGSTTTVAGDGSYGCGGDGGPATDASLGSPQRIAVDAHGRLLIADTANNRVRMVELPAFAALSPAAISFGEQLKGTPSAPHSITVTITGLVQLNISEVGVKGANAGEYNQTNTCVGSLKPGAKCVLNVVFTPAEAGSNTATLEISDDAWGSPQKVLLSGMGTEVVVGSNLGSSYR
jgi:trimeric autotransporter adhesin